MFSFLTQFGESGSGIAALGIDGKAFIIQLVTFVLAFLVLKKWVFGPIAKIMRERYNTIESGVKLGEKMKQQEVDLREKVEESLAKARTEADGIIESARETARQQVAAAETDAKKKSEQILDEAAERIKQDITRSRHAIEGEVMELIAEATEAVIDEKIDSKKDAGLLAKALKSSGGSR